MSLLRPRRFRPARGGAERAVGPSATGTGNEPGRSRERPTGDGTRTARGSGRGIGSLLTKLDESAGDEANEVYAMLHLEPFWVTEAEAEGSPIVHGNGLGIRDRAAALSGENGVSADVLLLNSDFRGISRFSLP